MDSFVGIEIGGTKLQLVTGTGTGLIQDRWRFQIDASDGASGIRRQIEEGLPELLEASSATAIGVGFGGPVDRENGRIAKSHQVEGWSDFPMVEWLQGVSGLSVAIENDANTAALGEARAGIGRDQRAVFYITLGSGIGGGLVVAGQVYHGAKPGESEIGHLRLDSSGTILEKRCSGWAVDQKIREAIKDEPKGDLARMVGNEKQAEARFLLAAIDAGDASARCIFDETMDELAFALSHVTHLFHPDTIVLGGGLSLMGERLRGAVAERIPRLIMEVMQPGPEIALAELGEDAVPVGALLLAADTK